jgi:hypothetical protein
MLIVRPAKNSICVAVWKRIDYGRGAGIMAKTIDLTEKLQEGYIDYVLTRGHGPESVYSFCKDLKLKEMDFYAYYSSFTDNDTPLEREFYFRHFREMISLVARPFMEPAFDFGQDSYFRTLFEYGDRVSRLPEFKRPRGSKHFIYVNRTNFGLYNILHELRAKVRTDTFPPKLEASKRQTLAN